MKYIYIDAFFLVCCVFFFAMMYILRTGRGCRNITGHLGDHRIWDALYAASALFSLVWDIPFIGAASRHHHPCHFPRGHPSFLLSSPRLWCCPPWLPADSRTLSSQQGHFPSSTFSSQHFMTYYRADM